jgi:hypothetical protein
MRTADFSAAPALARAEALVVTDRARTARGAAGLVRQRRFAERAVGPDGGTVRRRGVLAFFASGADADRFVAGLRADGGFAHVYAAEPEGYSNGVWRAEDGRMASVERFTALSGERRRGVAPPLVAGSRPEARAEPVRRTPRAPRTPRTGRAPGTGRTNPGLVDARSMFVGATRYTGPHAWLALARTWSPMVAKMQRLRGFRWYAVYYDPPFTLGTLAFFSGRDELLAFARMPEHRDLMLWITNGTRWGTGGYIRLQHRDDDGGDA